jgi:hypothetical protein
LEFIVQVGTLQDCKKEGVYNIVSRFAGVIGVRGMTVCAIACGKDSVV